MKILISLGTGDPANYLRALEAAGAVGEARYLPREDEGYDGLILAGGGDMAPHRYGQENWACRKVIEARDEAELALLDRFLARGKPVLGICRGHQVANVWAGGDLIQDLGEPVPDHSGEGDRVHILQAEKDSWLGRLYGSRFPVNSNHHQGVGRPGAGLRIVARSEDGVVEAMEHERLPLFTVQFHPERMTALHARPDTVDGLAIFRDFLERCAAVEK